MVNDSQRIGRKNLIQSGPNMGIVHKNNILPDTEPIGCDCLVIHEIKMTRAIHSAASGSRS